MRFDPRILDLANRRIFLGTSSWKYPGWQGLIYRDNYASKKEFDRTCLQEYAETFAAVGVDHTYYDWPSQTTFDEYVTLTPDHFLFALKATEQVTVLKYPNLKRYGKFAGKNNPDFLNADLFLERFVEPLRPYQTRLAPVMLEFSQFYPGMIASGREFVEKLDNFLSTVRAGAPDFRYAVELRNRNWLTDDYFACLVKNESVPVLNSWTRMPPVDEQLALVSNYEWPSFVARILLEPGVKYADAVEAFSPYNKICVEHPRLRSATASILREAINRKIPAYVFVNNRAEGCSPHTIRGILDLL